MVDRHAAHGHEAGGEILCRSDATLHGVGYHVEVIGGWNIVLGEETCIDRPFAEILAHLGFEHAAAQGQLAFAGGPLVPFVGSHAAERALAVGERGADIVAAEHYGLFQFILVLEFLAALRLGFNLKHCAEQKE